MSLNTTIVLLSLAAVLILSSCNVNEVNPQTIRVDDSDAHTVLAYGYGIPSTGLTFSRDGFINYAVPELLVYENGLVVFSCRGETWPELCQNDVSSERVGHLFEELTISGFFNESRQYTGGVGPRSFYIITAQTKEAHSSITWASNSFGPYPPPEPLQSVLGIIEAFREEVSIGQEHYQPENVALWIWKPCKCTPRSDIQTGGICNYCDDLDVIPGWPFPFEPPYSELESYECEQYLELSSRFSDVILALPDLEHQPLWPSGEHIFRDGTTLLSVTIRPYLPGETIQVSCSEDRWTGLTIPVYDSLPWLRGDTE
jgi:hypothetical protein